MARATGLTSRTLRHYEQIGLLHPSRVASNGYRFYGEAELSRLYRILSLRALELPLATIQIALDDDKSLAETIQSHLALLEERRERTNQQITVVRQTLNAVQKGQHMSIEEVFAGVDQSQYETEVRQRWGDDAWERSAKRRDQMTDEARRADDERSLDVNAALREAAESNVDPTSDVFQTLVGGHYKWVTEYWNGRKPDRDAYTGLSHLYVTDPRFAATYGGQANAELIRTAIQSWIETNLP
ncbi:MerR family transcriptional regulator [Microbacterium sp. A94]|uniref:MerR family transcriptional regulator n=1 Tax=Microbacterium sp. A94 TaxID=3450717 RepID=UPI003F4292A6